MNTTAGTAWYKSDSGSGIDRKLVDATKTALKLGYYHLDAAEVYNTEAEVGIAIKESKVPREKLFVTTKVITNIQDVPNAINQSLEKLQLDYVDLSVSGQIAASVVTHERTVADGCLAIWSTRPSSLPRTLTCNRHGRPWRKSKPMAKPNLLGFPTIWCPI